MKEAIFEYRCVEKFGYATLHALPPTSAYVWRMKAIMASESAAQAHQHRKQMHEIESQKGSMERSRR